MSKKKTHSLSQLPLFPHRRRWQRWWRYRSGSWPARMANDSLLFPSSTLVKSFLIGKEKRRRVLACCNEMASLPQSLPPTAPLLWKWKIKKHFISLNAHSESRRPCRCDCDLEFNQAEREREREEKQSGTVCRAQYHLTLTFISPLLHLLHLDRSFPSHRLYFSFSDSRS